MLRAHRRPGLRGSGVRGRGKGYSKFTQDEKFFVCACFVVQTTTTASAVKEIFMWAHPGKTMSLSSVRTIRREGRISLKKLRTRKLAWNTPESIAKRRAHAGWFQLNNHRYKALYYDEQNYNVHMTRGFGYSAVGLNAIVENPARTGTGGALSLHMAVSPDYGLVYAMVVCKDADQVTTCQYLRGLAKELKKLDEAGQRGRRRVASTWTSGRGACT